MDKKQEKTAGAIGGAVGGSLGAMMPHILSLSGNVIVRSIIAASTGAVIAVIVCLIVLSLLETPKDEQKQ